MSRIEYQPEDIREPADLVAAIRARRGGRLNGVDRMLLYAPPIAAGWNKLFLALRSKLVLPAKYREMAICGIASLHGNRFEIDVHGPIYLRCGGTERQLAALHDFESAAEDAGLFDAAERAVMRFTIESTRHVQVSDATFDAVRSHLYDDRQLVELVAVVAAYNMSARLIAALKVE